MKKCALLLISISAMGLYVCKYHPDVKAKIIKPLKKIINKIHI